MAIIDEHTPPCSALRRSEGGTPALFRAHFLTKDGLRLPVRRWEAVAPKAIIIALHGLGDYSKAFELPGRYWARHGITVLAYDQRGFGASPSPGLWAGGQTMREDFVDFIAAVRAMHPHVPLYALGASMGAAVVLSSLDDARCRSIFGAILCAPAIWDWKDIPVFYRSALWLAGHVAPWLRISTRAFKLRLSDNVEMLRSLDADRNVQPRPSAGQLYGLVDLMDSAWAVSQRLHDGPPVLVLYGARDVVVPAALTRAMVAQLGHRSRAVCFPDGHHMLLRDRRAEDVWWEVARWISSTEHAAISARPC